MTVRTMRRRVIIREYDFNKVQHEIIEFGNCVLYDRAEFIPLDRDALEKIKLTEILKGKTGPWAQIDESLKDPCLTLYQLKDFLYNKKYYDWNPSLDDDGYICVQARRNTPKTRIGWGVFEKDFECRI